MIDQINELPEDGLKSSPETSRYIENTWFSRKIKISCTFLHLVDILNDLKLIMHTNVEYLSCGKVEALGYFQLSDMRYNERNMVTERASTTFLQL